LGLFSLETRRLRGDLRAAFQYLKGPTRKLKRDFLLFLEQAHSNMTRGNGFKLKEGRFRLDIKQIIRCERGE